MKADFYDIGNIVMIIISVCMTINALAFIAGIRRYKINTYLGLCFAMSVTQLLIATAIKNLSSITIWGISILIFIYIIAARDCSLINEVKDFQAGD